MKIISWNVNGIRSVSQKGFFDFLQKASPEILVIQETKANTEQLSNEILEPDGYKTFWNSAQKKGYSGVAIFSKTEPEKVVSGIGIPKFDGEGRVLLAKFEKFTLLNIYFPSGQRDLGRVPFKMEFNEAISDFCKNISEPLIVSGDFNVAHKERDLKNYKANVNTSGFLPIEREWLDRFVEAGFIDTFREFEQGNNHYSWWSYQTFAREKNIGWRIDYNFITKSLKPFLKNAYILPQVFGSDHCPVVAELEF